MNTCDIYLDKHTYVYAFSAMQSVRARLRLLAAGVLGDTHRQSEEDDSKKEEVVVGDVTSAGASDLMLHVKTYADRGVLAEIDELLAQKPSQVEIDPLGPSIKENEMTDKNAIRRAVDKAVLSAAQHDTSICPLVIYGYEQYTSTDNKKVEPDQFNNNMRLTLYAKDVQRFTYAVASLEQNFVLLCKQYSTNRGNTVTYMTTRTMQPLTYAGGVECLLHTTETPLGRWLMLAKILKPQKLPKYSKDIINNAWFHNQIKPENEQRSHLNSWNVSAKKYIDDKVETRKKDIIKLQENTKKRWDLMWAGSFLDWIEKKPDSKKDSDMWNKLIARAKDSNATNVSWDVVQTVVAAEEIASNEFWDAYHKAKPSRIWGPIGTIDPIMFDTSIPKDAPKKTWTRGNNSDIAQYYDIFFNENQQQYSCKLYDLEAKILLDLMTGTYLNAETKNREQKISDLLQKDEAGKIRKEHMLTTLRTNISSKESNIKKLKDSQKKGEGLIKQQEQLQNKRQAITVALQKNKASFTKNKKQLQYLEKELLQFNQKLAMLEKVTLSTTDPTFVQALEQLEIRKHSQTNTIQMQLEKKQMELKEKVSWEIRNLVQKWVSYVTTMKDKQKNLDEANEEIQTLKTNLEHPELALGYWQRPAVDRCLFFVLVKHQPYELQGENAVYQEEEVVLQWFEVENKNQKIILKHRRDKVTFGQSGYELEAVPSPGNLSKSLPEIVVWP